MAELLLAAGLLLVLFGSGAVLSLLPWEAVLAAGVLLVAGGLLLGVPTGFYYHVLLRRGLLRAGPLPHRWWLQPTRWHGRVEGAARRAMMRWFFAGGAGFVLVMLGCALLCVGALRGR